MNKSALSSSFRDPNGFLFRQNGQLYRQVNQGYAREYDLLMSSGLYEKLIKAGQLIKHTEVEVTPAEAGSVFKVIQPELVPFISYPYEWSFSQLKDAALLTLSIQKRAIKYGMALKDASAYNIQFYHGKAVLIDSLSFEIYKDGEPWTAYKQFCQHFLAPLALMSKTDIRLNQLLRVYIDGVPLDLASRLLPFSTRFNFGLLSHLHLHAKVQSRYADKEVQVNNGTKKNSVNKDALLSLIDNLADTIKKLEWKPVGTEWGNYYEITNYSNTGFDHKKELVATWTKKVHPSMVWDLGANNGEFTRLASGLRISSIAFDIDPAAVEQNYCKVKADKETNLLPLLLDLTNPSPAIGWHNRERDSLTERAPADLVYALAIIHHLAISNNVPLNKTAEFFADMGKWLIIEFVPKTDSQVQKLLTSRLDIFDRYTKEGFEKSYSEYFKIHACEPVNGSERFLYLMEKLYHIPA